MSDSKSLPRETRNCRKSAFHHWQICWKGLEISRCCVSGIAHSYPLLLFILEVNELKKISLYFKDLILKLGNMIIIWAHI